MGTLDDAIRQHLDLKRRRGATDSELQRLEDEAFGPPSRPGEPDFPEQEGGSAEQSGNGVVAEARRDPDEHEAAEAQTTIYEEPGSGEPELGELDLELDEEAAPAGEPVAPEESPDAAPPEPPIEALDTVEHEMPEPDVEPAEEPEPSGREPEAAAEVEEASEQGEAESGEADQEDDMLADTPEFLRDAPEDDELWFEQGKPKDFDF
jgi:hypothetical protein